MTDTVHKSWLVSLTYFDKTGKYYISGSYVSMYESVINIRNEVKQKIVSGTLPGLPDSNEKFTVLVSISLYPLKFREILNIN